MITNTSEVEKAEKHIETLELILKQSLNNTNKKHKEISLLNEQAYNTIINKWNETEKVFPKDKTIQQAFEEQVLKTPDNTALVFEGEKLSYKELNEKSNQLAPYILEKSIKLKTNTELTPRYT